MNKESQEFHNYYPPNKKKLQAAKDLLSGKSKEIYIKNLISNNQDLSTTSEND
ncbi:MAG: hypothetical protein K9I68_04210 [Bacteroidales bacterium]|nr:hypothetical protein [Bacteroidales bacterium]MCF8336567.1 hypothetical protein [Bacteroidales bacterium]